MSESEKTRIQYKIAEPRKPGLRCKTQITKIEEVLAGEVFRDKARDSNQIIYAIYGRVDDREIRIATYSKPQGHEISPKSRLAQFKQRYKQFPTPRMRVDLVTNDKGFWTIAL